MTDPSIIDVDLRPAADDLRANDDTRIGRSSFLRRAVLFAGALGAGELVLNGLPEHSSSAPSTTQDDKIFAFILTLEQLQVAFYTAALDAGVLKDEPLQFAKVVGGHEREHLAYLEAQLSRAAPAPPTFRFGAAAMTSTGFLTAVIGVEELGLGAYNGQAPNLTPAGLRRAGRIISVEARHVAWARDMAGDVPAPNASDTPLTQAQVLSTVKASGYVG